MPAAPSAKEFSHWRIWLGWTSKRLASSAIVMDFKTTGQFGYRFFALKCFQGYPGFE